MNKERLLKLADILEKKPEVAKRFDMEHWGDANKLICLPKRQRLKAAHTCGAPACIGGWAVLLFGTFKEWERYNYKIEIYAQHLLGLGSNGGLLFYTSQWPQPYRGRHAAAVRYGNPEMEAQVAAERIRYFVAEGI